MEFLKWMGDAWQNHTFKLSQLGNPVARALRGDRPVRKSLGATIACAVFDLHARPEKGDAKHMVDFWDELGKQLYNGKPLPPETDREKFKDLFLTRLGFSAQGAAPVGLIEQTTAELLQVFSHYMGSEADQCWQLVTRGINLGSGADALRLAQVYVELDTKSPRPRRAETPRAGMETERNLSALEVLFAEDNRRIVLVGEPGSGKSTFVQFVLLCLTYQHSREPKAAENFAGLDGRVPSLLRTRQDALVPFRIILRDFAAELDANSKGVAEDVVKYLTAQVRDRCCPETADKVPEVLRRGFAFVLFDGLDEVPRSRVPAVRQAIQLFSQGDYGQCRVAVTCRTRSYEMVERLGTQKTFVFKLDGFPPPVEIAPLTQKQQAVFVEAWYRELERAQPQFKKGEGATCASTLIAALVDDRLQEMAGNPFFLTAMAALHRPDKALPNTSAELMDELVKGVLEEARKRQTTATSSQPELAVLLANIPDGFKLLRLRLETVAYLARENRQDRESRFVDEDTLRQKLRLTKTVDDDWVDKLLDALRHRAGLLQSQDGAHFEFAYRFEEFLAGCHLANEDAWPETSFETRCRGLFHSRRDYARQVVLWAAGFLVHVRHRKSPVRALISTLVPRQPVTAQDAFSLVTLELAVDITRDVGLENWQDEDVPDATDTAQRLRTRLEEVRGEPQSFDAKTRARAASAIGRLGDPRPGVGLHQAEPLRGLPDIQFVPAEPEKSLPAGKIILGETKKPVTIEQPYRISRYPVTVAQFQAFVDDKGYEQDRFWSAEGQAWRDGKADAKAIPDWYRAEYEKETFPIRGPKPYDPVFQTPNHPRVGVCWFEAMAFCRWLTERLRAGSRRRESAPTQEDQRGLTSAATGQFEIRLPREAEWEQAARWDGKKADDRSYPWGACDEKELARHCNCHQTGIGHTSAVGLFPSGDAKCGAADMAGNVWEWCENWYDEKAKTSRVVRGGSWFLSPGRLRSAFRFGNAPVNRVRSLGFRCVWVAGFSP